MVPAGNKATVSRRTIEALVTAELVGDGVAATHSGEPRSREGGIKRQSAPMINNNNNIILFNAYYI